MAPTRLVDDRVLRGAATPSALPLDFAERAVRRFGWLALGFALTQILVYLMGAFVQPGWIDPGAAPPLYTISVAGAAILGFAFCALAWSERIPAPLMLDLALVFEVLAALGIGLAENAITWPPNEPIRGLSAVEVWIVLFVLAVPSTFGKGLLAAITAALMAPLGLTLNILSGAVESPALTQWITLSVPTLAMAVCASVIARFIYNLTGQLGKLREMGSYHLIEPLGSGGMGEVWIAQHSLLARRVAIKLIRPEAIHGAYSQEVRAVKIRFEREAQAIASLSSPNTVALYDFGSTEDGTFYYVMELLEGIDLYKLIRDYGPVNAARAVHIIVQICDALAEAHDKGIVHRDIKPPNIVLSIQGCTYDFAKVLDFGLAKSLGASDDDFLTRPGTTLGTPAFMAPEAVSGKTNLNGQADVYSLGCVTYFLLTGSLVFPEKSGLAMALAHTHEAPLPPSARTELPIPPALDRLVLQCLAKDPDARPAGCRELAERLSQSIAPATWPQAAARHWWEINRPSIPNRGENSPLPDAGRTLRKQTSASR